MNKLQFQIQQMELLQQQREICLEYGFSQLLQDVEKTMEEVRGKINASIPYNRLPDTIRHESGYNRTLTAPQKCGIIQSIKRIAQKIRRERK